MCLDQFLTWGCGVGDLENKRDLCSLRSLGSLWDISPVVAPELLLNPGYMRIELLLYVKDLSKTFFFFLVDRIADPLIYNSLDGFGSALINPG